MSTQTTDLSDLIAVTQIECKRIGLQIYPEPCFDLFGWIKRRGLESWEDMKDVDFNDLITVLQSCKSKSDFIYETCRSLYPIKVVNGAVYGWVGTQYVGRPMRKYLLAGSPLANPYLVKDHVREKCIEMYRAWLWRQYTEGLPPLAELRRLLSIARQKPLILSCWCEPEPCHAEVIRSCLMWLQKTGF